MESPSAQPAGTVLWLPSHPAVGAVSMDRYWRELENERRRQAASPPPFRICCPLGEPPAQSRVAPRWNRLWQKYLAYPWLTRRCARSGVDLVHVLDHTFAYLLAQTPRRSVFKIVTVHDLAPLRDSSDLTSGQRQRFRRSVEHLKLADLLLADSQHTAADTAELLGIEPEKIHVLPLGVDVERFLRAPAGPPPHWLEPLAARRVILSVGSAAGRKNLQLLPDVFRKIRSVRPGDGIALLRVGEPLPEPLKLRLQEILGPAGLVELVRASEADLIAAYQHADALVFPSTLEGFGFPLLEAMSAGCPVVSSDASSLPEVGGEAALYFAPHDPVQAARHLSALLTDAGLRQRQIAAGRARAAAFTWTRHWQALMQIYARALKN